MNINLPFHILEITTWYTSFQTFSLHIFYVFKKELLLRVCVCVCESTDVFGCLRRSEEGTGSPRAGLKVGCEPFNVGARNQAQILRRNSKCP